MALTGTVGDNGVDIEVIEQTAHALHVLGHVHRHADYEGAVGGCRRGGAGHLCLRSAAEPPQSLTAVDGVDDLGTLHRNTAIGSGQTTHADGVAVLVGILVFVKGDLEGRTLVLLDMEGRAAAAVRTGGRDIEAARETALRKDEVGTGRTIAVRRRRLRAHALAIGIEELEFHSFVADSLRRQRGPVGIPGDGGDMDGLAGTVEVPVSEGLQARCHRTVVRPIMIRCVEGEVAAGLVIVGIGIDAVRALALGIGEDDLAVVVGDKVLCHCALLAVAGAAYDEVGTTDGAPRRGVDNGKTHTVVGQRLVDDIEVADIEQLALHLDAGSAGRGLDEVDADRKALDIDGVGVLLPGRLADIAACGREDSTGDDEVFHLGIALGRGGVDVGIARCLDAVDVDGELVDIADAVDAQGALHAGQHHSVTDVDGKRWLLEVAEGIAQDVHPRPSSPAREGVVDVVDFVLGGDVVGITDGIVMHDGELTGLTEVTIDGDKGVYPLHVPRLAGFGDDLGLLGGKGLGGKDAGGGPVVMGGIIVAELAVGLGFHTKDVEKVAIEDAAVLAADEGGTVVLTLRLGQQRHICQRGGIHLAALLSGFSTGGQGLLGIEMT